MRMDELKNAPRRRAERTLAMEVGCAAALFIICIGALPLGFALAWAGAHCQPEPQCQSEVGADFIKLLALLLIGAAAMMLLVKAVTARVWGPILARDAAKQVRQRAELLAFAIILIAGGVLYLPFAW